MPQFKKPESRPHTLMKALGTKVMGTARARDNLMLLKILAIALAPLCGIAATQAGYCHYTSPTLTINQCIAREMTPSVSARAPGPRTQPAATPRSARTPTKGGRSGR